MKGIGTDVGQVGLRPRSLLFHLAIDCTGNGVDRATLAFWARGQVLSTASRIALILGCPTS